MWPLLEVCLVGISDIGVKNIELGSVTILGRRRFVKKLINNSLAT
jgi:hypothetical protein